MISGPKKIDHIHLIFPNDPLAARPISMPSKKRVSVGSLGSEICTQKQLVSPPLKTKINSVPTNHRQWWVLWGFALVHGCLRRLHAKTLQHPPLSVIGWNTICLGFECLAKPGENNCFCVQISEPRLPTETRFFDGMLMGRAASGSLGKNIYIFLGLKSLIPPLTLHQAKIKRINLRFQLFVSQAGMYALCVLDWPKTFKPLMTLARQQ